MSQITEFLKRKPYLNITVSSSVEAKFKEMFPEVPYNVDDDFVKCVTTPNLKKVSYLRDWQGIRTHYPDVWGYVPFMYDHNQFFEACEDCSRSNFMQQNFCDLALPNYYDSNPLTPTFGWGMVVWVSISEARSYFNKYNLTRSPSIQIKADSMTVVTALAATSDYFLEWDVTFLNTVALDAWDAIYELYGTDMLLSRGMGYYHKTKLAYMRRLLMDKQHIGNGSVTQIRTPEPIINLNNLLGLFGTSMPNFSITRLEFERQSSLGSLILRLGDLFWLHLSYTTTEVPHQLQEIQFYDCENATIGKFRIEQFNIIRPSKKVDAPLSHEDYVCLLFALLYQTPRKSKYGWCYVVNHRNVYLNEISS